MTTPVHHLHMSATAVSETTPASATFQNGVMLPSLQNISYPYTQMPLLMAPPQYYFFPQNYPVATEFGVVPPFFVPPIQPHVFPMHAGGVPFPMQAMPVAQNFLPPQPIHAYTAHHSQNRSEDKPSQKRRLEKEQSPDISGRVFSKRQRLARFSTSVEKKCDRCARDFFVRSVYKHYHLCRPCFREGKNLKTSQSSSLRERTGVGSTRSLQG